MKRPISVFLYSSFLIFIGVLISGLIIISSPLKADCLQLKKDPYPTGLYASQLLEFKAGFWIETKGPMFKGRGLTQKKKLHDTRLIYPSLRVLGCPKSSLEKSLTLGHKGHVIVGPVKCFKNGKGPDILIHEPRSDMNVSETFNVYVTPDEKGVGPWYEVVRNVTVSAANNFLEIELDGIVTKRGYPIKEFSWVKVEDANSQVVASHPRFSGFDVSAVKFMHQCNIPMS